MPIVVFLRPLGLRLIRNERSRTKKLCETFIEEFQKKHPHTQIEEVKLEGDLVVPLTNEEIDKKTEIGLRGDWDHPEFRLAKQFKNADYILIGAPYWDLSFPSILKVYIERVLAANFTFSVENPGERMCNAKNITYIMTCGGPLIRDYGYEYIQGIATLTGINSTQRFYASHMDIEGEDVEAILEKTKKEIRESFM